MLDDKALFWTAEYETFSLKIHRTEHRAIYLWAVRDEKPPWHPPLEAYGAATSLDDARRFAERAAKGLAKLRAFMLDV